MQLTPPSPKESYSNQIRQVIEPNHLTLHSQLKKNIEAKKYSLIHI